MILNVNMQRVAVGIGCLLVAIVSHLFFISEFFNGRYMTGLNDGLSQMIPFKYFLYNAFTNGDFFYSENFGLGGGTFSQLGYYFSTSVVFIVTVIITFLLEKMGIIDSPSLFYWADAILVISILRMTSIIALTTYYFQIVRFSRFPAFIGACIYGTSVIYFRHVTYWEFFADAMLFFPLLLIGVEKIMREGKAGWFIAAVALNMIDNFYFAYVNFLLAFIYIVFRWGVPLFLEKKKKWQQVKLFLAGGFAGAGISAPFFIPSVYGYLNNFRPAYDDAIPLIGAVDNLLLHGRLVILPAFVLLCLLIVPFYKNRTFRFFAGLTVFLCIIHYSPMVGSLFNGLSAPQYRWEHFLSLAAGGVAAASLQQLHSLRMKDLIYASVTTAGLYTISYVFDPKLKLKMFESYLLICAVITISLFFLFVWNKKKWVQQLMIVFLLFTTLLTANKFQAEKLTYKDRGKNKGPDYGITRDYMESEHYYGVDQRTLIRKLQTAETDPFARIDWMVDTRNNTPIVQDFKGMSIYSSILNKHLLSFYLHDLQIDMRRESVSRYASLGDRANLYSLLNGTYAIRKEGGDPIPFGFTEAAKEGEYRAYKNEYVLPFARTTSTLFAEEDMKDLPALAKEHAMLTGVIMPNVVGDAPPQVENLISNVTIKPIGGSFEDGVLKVTKKIGGVDLVLSAPTMLKEDSFVSFFIQRKTNDKDFTLKVNDFTTERKKNDSIYRTKINELMIRVASEEEIAIRVPKGEYELRDISLYTEDYTVLKTAKEKSEDTPRIMAEWSGNKAKVLVDNQQEDTHVVLPIPYELGWTARVNGQKQPVLRANYAFSAIELQDGANDIEMTYYPPYFFPSIGISIFTMGLVLIGYRRRKINELHLNNKRLPSVI